MEKTVNGYQTLVRHLLVIHPVLGQAQVKLLRHRDVGLVVLGPMNGLNVIPGLPGVSVRCEDGLDFGDLIT